MSKIAQHNKAQVNKSGKAAIIEHETMIDDSMIPTAEELKKLQDIDPKLVDWVLDRVGKEQDFRHEFDRGKLKLANKDLRGNILLNFLCIMSALLIIAGAMFVTVRILESGLDVAGTIFAAGTVIGAAALFTRIPKHNNNKQH